MRDITAYPITVEEVRTALQTAATEASFPGNGVGTTDGLCLHYLGNFLESVVVQKLFEEKLDELQPKCKDVKLEALDRTSLEKLLKHALANYGTKHVFTFRYEGISNRGSYVYDLNEEYDSRHRLYVRIQGGDLRGELNEDNFTISRPHHPPHLNAPGPSMDTPVSARWHWLQLIKAWFKDQPK